MPLHDPRRILPEPVTGYELSEDEFGYFTIVKGRGTVNLFPNPAFTYYHDTDYSYGTTNGTLTVDGPPFRAFNGGKLTHTNLALRSYIKCLIGCTAGLMYWFSVYVYGTNGHKYHISVRTAGEATVSEKPFTGIGEYQRVSFNFIPSSTANYYFCVERDAGQVAGSFTTDGWQLEQSTVLTTYCDGWMGRASWTSRDHYWNGIANKSSSTRAQTSNYGGEEIKFRELNMRLYGIQGLGVPPVENISNPISLGGEYFQKQQLQAREFTLNLAVYGSSEENIRGYKHDIDEVFNPTRAYTDQPVLLKFYKPNSGAVYNIPAYYVQGLSGNVDNYYQERINLTFKQFQPVIEKECVTSATGVIEASINGRGLLMRTQTGVWSNVGVTNGTVYKVLEGPDGKIYICGSFTTIGGVAYDRVARYDPYTAVWEGFPSVGATVESMCFSKNLLVIVGRFINVGGAAANDYIVCRDVFEAIANAWTHVCQPDNFVYDIDSGIDSRVYFVGDFLNVDATASHGFAVWDFATSTGVFTTAIPDGQLKIAIRHTNGEIKGDYPDIFTYHISVTSYVVEAIVYDYALAAFGYFDVGWLETSVTPHGLSMTVDDKTGDLYVAGDFTEVGGDTDIVGFAKFKGTYNGNGYDTDWYRVSNIGDGTSFYASGISIGPITRKIYIAGNFTYLEDFEVQSGLAAYDQGNWYSLGFTGSWAYCAIEASSGVLFVGTQSGSTTPINVSSPVEFDNPGTQESYPHIKITAGASSCKLFGIKSTYDDVTFQINGYTLQPGEFVVIKMYNALIYSAAPSDDFDIFNNYGKELDHIARVGTTPLRVAPGRNRYELLKDSPGGTPTMEIFWYERYASIEDI